MPTFPTYPDELPACLNPLNPKHYLLVAYWVLFRPTALKCYLYRSREDIYRDGRLRGFLVSFFAPAYFNLYLISFLAGLLPWSLDYIFSLQVPFIPPETGSLFNYIQDLSLAFVSLFIFCVSLLWPFFGVVAAIVIVLNFWVFTSFSSLAFGLDGGMMAGAVFVTAGGAIGIEAGTFTFSVVVISVLFIINIFSHFNGNLEGTGIDFGSAAMGIAASLRFYFYLLQGGGVLSSHFASHPLFWDELGILPYFKAQTTIQKSIGQSEADGIKIMSQIAANPFQRWVLQRTLYYYLHFTSENKLSFVYTIFYRFDFLNSYVIAPIKRGDWYSIPSVRQVLVSELAGCGNAHTRGLEGFVWQLTKSLRTSQSTPLTNFVHLLYQLVWGEYADEALPTDFDLGRYRPVYSRLIDYPGGQEIQQSFECMAQCLNYRVLAELAQADDGLSGLPAPIDAIRPPVILALQQFGQIGRDIAVFQAATSRVNQLAALGRATDALEAIRADINDHVLPPEQKILQAIVRRWRKLIADAIGALGQLTITEPIPNPYVAGNPVSGELFVGREEVLRELEELWLQPGQTDSVLLYGHRRMGKSSILKNLPQRLDAQRNWVVEFNLQRVGKVRSTGELLYALALEMSDRLPPDENLPVSEPDEAPFFDQSRNPYQAFNYWLKQLKPHMMEQVEPDTPPRIKRRFIIAIDEFELLEAAIDDQRLEADLIEYLRGLINTTDWFVIALAGLYTLQEKTHDYWNPLFGSIKPRKVSFLSPQSTRRLITQPSPDFPIDYTQDALDEIVGLTSGQPYLVQLIGQNLVAQFNHQVFEAEQDADRPISLADLRAVIDSPEFFQDGGAYFTGVWRQAEDSDPPGQPEILTALCRQDCSIAELTTATGLNTEQVAAAIKTLEAHDVIHTTESGRYSFTVELMRRWVQRRQSS